ncbi:MAG: hypothetical protein JW827_00650 [Spirochaetes bacterium]|nr:hypothetical protein [Spirochaetota bacterium]
MIEKFCYHPLFFMVKEKKKEREREREKEEKKTLNDIEFPSLSLISSLL